MINLGFQSLLLSKHREVPNLSRSNLIDLASRMYSWSFVLFLAVSVFLVLEDGRGIFSSHLVSSKSHKVFAAAEDFSAINSHGDHPEAQKKVTVLFCTS